MKFAFYTLGCKTNQYETQAMEQLLLQQGHQIGSFDIYAEELAQVQARAKESLT